MPVWLDGVTLPVDSVTFGWSMCCLVLVSSAEALHFRELRYILKTGHPVTRRPECASKD